MPILDSDIIIQFLRDDADAIRKIRQLQENHSRLRTTVVNVGELSRGANLSSKVARNTRLIADFLKILDVIPYKDEDAAIFGQISAELQLNGSKIGDLDEIIASIAISHDEILITRNEKHFRAIPRLKYESW